MKEYFSYKIEELTLIRQNVSGRPPTGPYLGSRVKPFVLYFDPKQTLLTGVLEANIFIFQCFFH
jgi:hypothetical protein